VDTDLESVSDEELARRAQGGSLEAFEGLVYRYERRLYAFVFQCCRSDADAREVTQDSFVRAFQCIAQFDTRRGFAPWLFTIARRKCIDRQRAQKPDTADSAAPELVDEHDPGELLARQEEREGLWRLAREVLPEVQFHALWLRYAEDMTVENIARVLGRTRTHVKVLLFRARAALTRKLKTARAPAGLWRQSPAVRKAPRPPAPVTCALGSPKKGLL
jgi:RNA polymerase sigma-70 factor (ECF subfamily)